MIAADGQGQGDRATKWPVVTAPQTDSAGRGGFLAFTPSRDDQRLDWVPIDGPVVGQPELLSRNGREARFAMNASGQAVVVWLEAEAGESDSLKLQVARRPAGGRFSRPQTLARTTSSLSYGLDVAIGTAGQLGIVFANPKGRAVQAWRGVVSAKLRRPVVLGRHDGSVQAAVAVGPLGGLTALWGTQSLRGGRPSRWRVALARVDAASSPKARVLDRGRGNAIPDGKLDVDTSPDGTALAIWTSVGAVDGERVTQTVRTASVSAVGRAEAPRILARDSRAASAIALPGHGFAVTWVSRTNPRYFAATVGSDATFANTDIAPARQFGAPDTGAPALPTLGLDHRGRPTFAFTQRQASTEPNDVLQVVSGP